MKSLAREIAFYISQAEAREVRSWPVKCLAHYFTWLACGMRLACEVALLNDFTGRGP